MGFVVIDDGVPSLLHSQSPRVRLESIDDAIARMTAGEGDCRGFVSCACAMMPWSDLRALDGNDMPRVTVPQGSSLSFEDYLEQLPS